MGMTEAFDEAKEDEEKRDELFIKEKNDKGKKVLNYNGNVKDQDNKE